MGLIVFTLTLITVFLSERLLFLSGHSAADFLDLPVSLGLATYPDLKWNCWWSWYCFSLVDAYFPSAYPTAPTDESTPTRLSTWALGWLSGASPQTRLSLWSMAKCVFTYGCSQIRYFRRGCADESIVKKDESIVKKEYIEKEDKGWCTKKCIVQSKPWSCLG